MFEPLRKAGAAAREMLISAASGVWGISPKDCEALKGRVRNGRSGESLSYGELSLEAGRLPIPKKPLLKGKDRFRLIDNPLQLLDIPDKIRGLAIFGTDIFVPDMLYGSILRPPVYGARIISYDKKTALKVPGVRKILKISAGIGICADTLTAALKEGVLFEKGAVKSSNFHNYPVLRMREAPQIEVHIVGSDEMPGGIGEVGVPPVAPAVANGLFHASGLRLRRLPLTPEAGK